MASSETPRSIPWYKRFREEFSKASRYIYAVERIPIKRETLENFDKETLARFIFESNNIEREGLPFGETKELVIYGLEEYPELLQTNNEQQQDIRAVNYANLLKLLQEVKKTIPIDFSLLNRSILRKDELKNNEIQSTASNYDVIAKYGGKTKEGIKVMQYLLATAKANSYASEFIISYNNHRLFHIFQELVKIGDSERREKAQKSLKEQFPEGSPNIDVLITEERIKALHEAMAHGFIDEKNAKAGQYRTKPIMTDMDSHYPAPEDIPAAMANFVKRYQEHESQNLNPIALAAWASTQFVLIHPFPDFNGRMSRLLMNMIFRAHGVPFWVSLSSSGKERKKYIAALRQAREGNYLWIATLISIQLNKGFHELNKMLDLSGYDQIEIDDSKEFPPEQSDKEILFTFLKNE